MNRSQINDGRFWKRWISSGAVDFTLRAKMLGKKIFSYDPFIGCPFDDTQVVMVAEADELSIGDRITYRGPNKLGTMNFPQKHGKIIAIGKGARYLNGEVFTALMIQVGGSILFKTAKEVSKVSES